MLIIQHIEPSGNIQVLYILQDGKNVVINLIENTFSMVSQAPLNGNIQEFLMDGKKE